MDATRFAPGAMLAGRYRVVALLGKGGMGEVYRAEDTKLGIAVAVKFLPDPGPAALDRLYSEVRLGRQVSHPNVCRIHDVFEADGNHFLSMEYVDGEDLASLLRRIGRLPAGKAVDILRDVCAGLAAAHAQGVLHRDLKPANVMIDGRGRARIADFGLAVLAEGAGRTGFAGTPAYTAPELLAGKQASVRSDLYALGLVAYEMLVGRRLFDGRSSMELRRQHDERTTLTISGQVPDIAAAVEQIVVRCLEEDPDRRPSSVREVLAALPGGDPLQAAIEAGDTPSPELVAAARVVGNLAPGRAWGLLATLVAGVLMAVTLSERVFVHRQVPFDKPPEVLAERAREIVARNVSGDRPFDQVYRFSWSGEYLLFLAAQATPQRFLPLHPAARQMLAFHYRQSPLPLAPRSGRWSLRDPPFDTPGMVTVVLGADGLLNRMIVVPPPLDDAAAPAPPPDFLSLISDAGFAASALEPAQPLWTPPVHADHRMAWTVRDAHLAQPVRIEAASRRGRTVFFRVLWPWDKPAGTPAPPPTTLFLWLLQGGFYGIANAVALIGAAVLARRNLKLGRSDRSGASTIASAYLLFEIGSRLLAIHYLPGAQGSWDLIERQLAEALLGGVKVWLAYLALEPFVRRRWPLMLVGWSRLLAGRVRDPLVGRDLLAGALAGTAVFLLWAMGHLCLAWLGAAPLERHWDVAGLSSVRDYAYWLTRYVPWVLGESLIKPFVLVLCRIVSRKDHFAYFLFVAVFVLFYSWLFPGQDHRVEVAFLAVMGGIFAWTLVRIGLLALTSSFLFFDALLVLPITMDMDSWYAGRSLVSLAVLLALAAWAFKVSLAGRPVLGHALET